MVLQINYTNPNPPNSYQSKPYPPGGPLESSAFVLQDLFIRSVFQVPVLPKEGLAVIDLDSTTLGQDLLTYLQDNASEVVGQNWRLVTTLVFGVLMIVAFPLTGLIACCCGSKEIQARKKGDGVSGVLQGAFLGFGLALCWLMMIWLVGAKVMLDNHVTQGLVPSVEAVAHDAQLFIEYSVTQVNYLVDNNFDQLNVGLNGQIDQIGIRLSTLINETIDDAQYDRLLILSDQTKFEDEYAQTFKDKITEVHDNVKEEVNKILSVVDNLNVEETFAKLTTSLDQAIHDYYGHVSYGTIFLPGFMGLILAFMTVGLVLTCCGGGCRRGGGNCICTGTLILLGLGWLLWILVTVLYVAGALVDHIGCETLEDPGKSPYYIDTKIPANLDLIIHDAINMEAFDSVVFDLPLILDEFSRGESIYEILHLELVFDASTLQDWQEEAKIEEVLEEVNKLIDEGLDSAVNALKTYSDNSDIENGQLALRELVNVLFKELQTDIQAIEVDTIVNSKDIAPLIEDLNEIMKLPDLPEDQLTNLRKMLSDLDPLPKTIEALSNRLSELKTKTKELLDSIINIVGSSAANRDDRGVFGEVDALLRGAIDILNATTRPKIHEAFNGESTNLVEMADGFFTHCRTFIEDDFATTEPVFNIYRGLVVSVCSSAIDPLNGLWSSVGLMLVLMIPIMILGTTLRNLLKRRKAMAEYPMGPFLKPGHRGEPVYSEAPASAFNPHYQYDHSIQGDSQAPHRVLPYNPGLYYPGYAGSSQSSPVYNEGEATPRQKSHYPSKRLESRGPGRNNVDDKMVR
eukprot:maker-scaffold439_size171548-snap-gene-0.25 protein:Tk02657 transcript:maker-scaffold439_size171548-snap-gene-0.25-mRNA-1 annotation:"prominin-like protein"